MKILVSGGAGFIGSHIVEHFQNQAEIRVLDNLRSGFRHNLRGLPHEFIEASVLDRAAVRDALSGVDYVFHLAAMVSVTESMAKPIECNEVNTKGTLVLLEEAARAGVKKLVFSSSAAVYGDNPIVPKVETMLPVPKSPYAISKLDCEYYCQMFADERGLPTVCLRYFNVFGPRQDPRSQYAAAIPIFIYQALKHEPIMIYGDGEQTRDFIYVEDIAKANAYFGIQSRATGIFNIGCGMKTSINDLSATLCQIARSTSKIRHGPARAGDVRHSMAGVEKMHAAGFFPGGNLADGLRATVKFFTANDGLK
jgi:UDP-glucose 4-epimerase